MSDPGEAGAKSTAAVSAVDATLRVAVDTPKYGGLDTPLAYRHDSDVPPGTIVRVTLGAREVAGIVWPVDRSAPGESGGETRELKPLVEALTALPPLTGPWCELVEFAARYYQRGIGEMALSVLPPELRRLDARRLAKRMARLQSALAPDKGSSGGSMGLPVLPPLSDEQHAVLERLGAGDAQGTFLLHGSTGSGKTEVYLRAAQRALAAGRQALVLVPEINLTPQLEARFAERFADRLIASQHSALTPALRLRQWLAAHLGLADLVLGTRLAVFASMPRLGLIVVDEEHDASYKQQEGARYSARDLAVYRGRLENVPVLLGSATPSLESWRRAALGRYRLLSMPSRIAGAELPQLRIVDMNRLPKTGAGPGVLAPPLVDAVQQRIDRGEQSLLFLNRRGYAPVLHCHDCSWKSACPHCTAWRVFHKHDRSLRCHHCGLTERVPRACPDCGNPDIAPIGRGTERLEEQLGGLLRGRNGAPLRLLRIDADSTRAKGALEQRLGAVHAGEVDVLVGTQMITKGHDFRRISLVAAVNPDSALFSSDFRAPERLFAILMQATGRAGRSAAQSAGSEMWLQTWSPRHPLYAALRRHDFAAFAADQLKEREMAGLPPYAHLALLRAEARSADAARGFLQAAADLAPTLPAADAVSVYPPVPMSVARVANVERMQMLVESSSRAALQRLLAAWLPALHELRRSRNAEQRVLRWAVDVDPLAI